MHKMSLTMMNRVNLDKVPYTAYVYDTRNYRMFE